MQVARALYGLLGQALKNDQYCQILSNVLFFLHKLKYFSDSIRFPDMYLLSNVDGECL